MLILSFKFFDAENLIIFLGKISKFSFVFGFLPSLFFFNFTEKVFYITTTSEPRLELSKDSDKLLNKIKSKNKKIIIINIKRGTRFDIIRGWEDQLPDVDYLFEFL